MDASRRIRLERNVAFPHPVELAAGSTTLTFAPITGGATMPRVPFETGLQHGRSASGFLWLWTRNDPLTIAFQQPPDPRSVPLVWAAVLVGFADLTAWPEQELVRSTSPSPTRSQRGPTRAPRERRLPGPRKRYLNSRGRLDIYALQAHFVVGHKRWLPDGSEASAEKLREAAELGMKLEPGQTWVTSHYRAGAARAPGAIQVW
jgi:hypothetical protein